MGVVVTALRWAAAWALYWAGDLLARIALRADVAGVLTPYRWVMRASMACQGRGPGPWADGG